MSFRPLCNMRNVEFYTSLRHSLDGMNEVRAQLVFRGSLNMSDSEVDSAARSMYVQVRGTSQLHIAGHRFTVIIS